MNAAGPLIIAPILIPFLAGALMLLYDDRQRRTKTVLGMVSAALLLAVAVELLMRSKGAPGEGGNAVFLHLLGNWPAPFGISLVLDRLSALMLVLTALLAIPALVHAAAGWQGRGQHFQPLFQFLLMGLNGAFLTSDLFNLFVFFEVMLAASYGLLLHGSGQLRVRAGLQYIAVNLTGSLLFLIGVSLIYGVTGTLSMAALSQMAGGLAEGARPLFHTGMALMGVAFLIKAGIWPLSFWLPGAYMAGAAPVAAIFAVLTKVGLYVILRLAMLLFGPAAGASAGFGSGVLTAAGMASAGFGLLGVLASQGLGRMAGYLVIVSSGTVLAACGMALAGGGPMLLAGALYYLVGSTIALACLFLLVEPMGREDGAIAALLALTADAWGGDPLEEDRIEETGLAIPGTLTVLGLCFGAVVVALAGLPPLPGFLGKVAVLSALLASGLPAPLVWGFLGLLLLAGLATLVALIRIGIQTFWAAEGAGPRVLALEIAPVLMLIGLLFVLTLRAEDALRYLGATAQALQRPALYSQGVLAAPRVEGEEAGG